ncbi:hypothetical protein ACFU76_17480 [Streptomyces sp. NPDC057539]|uniref:hypothetical protein n=1 Tax=Streptomyces sp. NPDC057539 TaxID=3346159 RepID=UPI0036790C2D
MKISLPAAPATPELTADGGRRLRAWSTVSVILLLPATILAGILALTGENVGNCIAYNENCGTTPGWVYEGSLLITGIAWVVVLCPGHGAVRRTALWIQLGAECTFLAAVLTIFW